MKVAAYQFPLDATNSTEKATGLISEQVAWCEANSIEILCCPEGVLGGLADYSNRSDEIAIDTASGGLETLLTPLSSDKVAVILGFTERGVNGRLYNSAAVFHKGAVTGIYRKLHPAINRSVYDPGEGTPVFTVGGLTFGIVICNDSNFPEPARKMTAQGAAVLFVPTNNGLPPAKGGAELIAAARKADIARATENNIYVIRADVAGHWGDLVSYGSSGIVDPAGNVLSSARQLCPGLITMDIKI